MGRAAGSQLKGQRAGAVGATAGGGLEPGVWSDEAAGIEIREEWV